MSLGTGHGSRWLMLCALLLPACDDAASGGRGGGGGDASTAPADDATTTPPPRRDGGRDGPDTGPTGPRAAYVELALDPRRPLYTLDDHPQAMAVVYDRYGNVLPDHPLRWDVPTGGADLDAEQRLTFTREGPGAVRACATPDLCGRASFFVDRGAPGLEITRPQRGELVTGDTLVVEGRTDDGTVAVFVNDRPATVAADGTFRFELRPTFGLNRIDAIADDGVRRPPTRVVMEVVWAPEVLEPTPTGVVLPESVTVRIDQTLLDTGAPPPAPDEAGVVRIADLAGIVEAFIARIEPLRLVDDPVLSDDESLSLRIDDVRPGAADASLLFTDRGLELFLRLTDFTIVPSGRLEVEGVPIVLDGAVQVTASAFALIAVEAGPGGAPRLRVEEAGVAIERLGGVMSDSTAQAVLDTFGSLLRTVLQSFATQLVNDLVTEEVPEFLELGLDDALATLRNIPLDVDDPDLGLAIHLDVGFELSDPRARSRDGLELGLSGAIRQRMPVAPPHPSRGIPAEGLDAAPPWPAAAGLAIGVRLVAVNALLHEVWRQGALQLDVSGQLPDDLSGLIASALVDARIAPLVVASPPGSPYFFELQVGELDLIARGPRSEAPDRYVISLRAGLVLEVGDGGIRFDIAEAPDVRVALLDQGGDRPILPPEALERLIGPLIWPKVREAIGEGLSLAIDPIVIGRDAYEAVAPGIAEIRVVPTFPIDPLVRRGWFVLSAGLETQLR